MRPLPFLLALLLFAPALVPAARAQACEPFVAHVADGSFSAVFARDAGVSASHLFPTHAGHSYFVEIRRASPGGTGILGATFCPDVARPGLRDVQAIDPFGTEGGLTHAAWTFTETDSGFAHLKVESGPAAVRYRVRMSDTTLWSAAWSTNGTYNTYYSFFNTTGGVCSGTLDFYDATGAQVGRQSVSAAPLRNASTNTVAAAVERNRTGSARFTHDCPPNAFLVEASIANFTTTPPYNQPVQMRAVRQDH